MSGGRRQLSAVPVLPRAFGARIGGCPVFIYQVVRFASQHPYRFRGLFEFFCKSFSFDRYEAPAFAHEGKTIFRKDIQFCDSS